MLPPMEYRVGVGKTPDMSDNCVSSIVNRVIKSGPLFGDLGNVQNIEISYPPSAAKARSLGSPIQGQADVHNYTVDAAVAARAGVQ